MLHSLLSHGLSEAQALAGLEEPFGEFLILLKQLVEITARIEAYEVFVPTISPIAPVDEGLAEMYRLIDELVAKLDWLIALSNNCNEDGIPKWMLNADGIPKWSASDVCN